MESPYPPSLNQLGPLEERLLRIIWERGSATVHELIREANLEIKYTTAQTTLTRLFAKDLLNRHAEGRQGRQFRYSPRFTEHDLKRMEALKAVRYLLDSDSTARRPLSLLVEVVAEYDIQLLDKLEQIVAEKRRQ